MTASGTYSYSGTVSGTYSFGTYSGTVSTTYSISGTFSATYSYGTFSYGTFSYGTISNSSYSIYINSGITASSGTVSGTYSIGTSSYIYGTISAGTAGTGSGTGSFYQINYDLFIETHEVQNILDFGYNPNDEKSSMINIAINIVNMRIPEITYIPQPDNMINILEPVYNDIKDSIYPYNANSFIQSYYGILYNTTDIVINIL